MISPILALIGVLAIFVLLDVINPLLSDIFIFFYFGWAFINIEGSTTLATFYLIAIIFVMLIRVSKLNFALKSKTIREFGGVKLAGKIPFLGIGLGIAIFMIMRLLQGASETAIIGTPSLAITSPAFNVTTIMLLGIVETRLFFTLYNLLKENQGALYKIPLLGSVMAILSPVLPIVLVSVLFSVFHITAYALSLSALLFAGMVMVLWVISFIITKSDLPANISHALWNGIVSLSKTLGIAI